MTRERMFGCDVDFCSWLRKNKNLPSYSYDCGIGASDTDLIVHRYLSSVDSAGTREIQAMMLLEVKTRGGKPSPSQCDTLMKFDLFRGQRKDRKQVTVRNFGVSVLSMSGLTPDDSDFMRWGRFSGGELIWKACDTETLIGLLKFEIHPDSYDPKPFRRHHLTREIIEPELTPLGFSVDRVVVHRS